MSGSTAAPAQVLVTGATGFLGGSIVRELLDSGSEVRALVRDLERGRQRLPTHESLRLVAGDVTQLNSFASELRGVDAIIHTAACCHQHILRAGDAELVHRTNVVAVNELLGAALRADVPVVVHVSSTSTVGPGRDGRLTDEDTPVGTECRDDAYYESKLRAEEAVRAFCERHELRVPIVLPGALWGPGDYGPTSTGRLFLQVARGELRAAPRAGAHVVDVRDVASACVRAAVAGLGIRRYLVAGTRWTISQICAEIARAAGSRAPRPLPARATVPLATMMEFGGWLRRRPSVANRTSARILLERDRVHISSERARRELGASFRPFERTLADEHAWYREQGLLL